MHTIICESILLAVDDHVAADVHCDPFAISFSDCLEHLNSKLVPSLGKTVPDYVLNHQDIVVDCLLQLSAAIQAPCPRNEAQQRFLRLAFFIREVLGGSDTLHMFVKVQPEVWSLFTAQMYDMLNSSKLDLELTTRLLGWWFDELFTFRLEHPDHSPWFQEWMQVLIPRVVDSLSECASKADRDIALGPNFLGLLKMLVTGRCKNRQAVPGLEDITNMLDLIITNRPELRAVLIHQPSGQDVTLVREVKRFLKLSTHLTGSFRSCGLKQLLQYLGSTGAVENTSSKQLSPMLHQQLVINLKQLAELREENAAIVAKILGLLGASQFHQNVQKTLSRDLIQLDEASVTSQIVETVFRYKHC